MVCDATGFSRKLTSKFGKKEKFEDWNCDAWTYFKEKDVPNVENRLEHWEYPATKHICFPEGWGWFIKLISWHHAPLSSLMDLVAYIIDNAKAGVPADEIPCTKTLSSLFDCPYEFITSLAGLCETTTNSPKTSKNTGGRKKVQLLPEKIPHIGPPYERKLRLTS
jgi:hypothetical protein